MKKIALSIWILAIAISLFACTQIDTNNQSILIDQISLSTEQKGLEVLLTFDESKLNISKSDITNYGINYWFEDIEVVQTINFEGNPFEIENGQLLISIPSIDTDCPQSNSVTLLYPRLVKKDLSPKGTTT